VDRPVVFLGPSLARDEARRILEAEYRPPVEQGAVFDVVERLRPGAIVIIDGAFAWAPAVRHKEILFAIDRGIPVLGAASLGALRAAELHGFGMAGYGLIYRWYRRTPFADDDEVAVGMAPAELGSQPLSEALVNMRLTLRRAERSGILSRDVRIRLEEHARTTHFLERSYEELLRRAALAGSVADIKILELLTSWLPAHAVDQKRADAVGLLGWLSRQRGLSPTVVSQFVWTESFAHDLAVAGLRCGPGAKVK
jgi:hypothetical protein